MLLRFGILGTGNIARQFAGAFKTSRRCAITAVGSRSQQSATDFCSGFCPAALSTTYEDLIRHDAVDAIYVSLPNSLHAEWTIRALEAGKHVLCEKPLAMTATEGERMFAAARAAGRHLVEAFMYVSHPLTRAYVAAVRGGAIGRVRSVRTSFCYRTARIAGNVRFDESLGGGALMDIGCYCLHFSRMITGTEPLEIAAQGVLHETGVDEQVAGLLRFPNDVMATFIAGMGLQADNTATIAGDEGYIEVPVPWKPPVSAARWVLARSTPPKMDTAGGGGTGTPAPAVPPRQESLVDAGKDLYALEADDFAATVLDGAPPAISEADSRGNLRAMDRIRDLIRPAAGTPAWRFGRREP